MFGADVHLDDLHVVGQEGVVREVRAEQDQQIALVRGLVGGAVAEQPAHADVVRIVVLDPLLAAQGVPDGRLDPARELHDLGVGPGGATAAEQGDLVGLVDQPDQLLDLPVAGAYGRPRGHERVLDALLRGREEAMSPGSATTPTPLRPMACWIALWSTRGICCGLEISSL